MSMRRMLVADVLAQELKQPEFVGGAHGEGQPTDAFISKPNSEPSAGNLSDAVLSLGLKKNFFRRKLGGWQFWDLRFKSSSSLRKSTNYFFKLSGRKFSVEMDLCFRKVRHDL